MKLFKKKPFGKAAFRRTFMSALVLNAALLSSVSYGKAVKYDFDGNRYSDLPVASSWGMGILSLSGSTLTSKFIAANGTNFDGWSLNTANNHFGPIEDYDGCGKTELLITNANGLGIFRLQYNSMEQIVSVNNGTRLSGGWLFNSKDNKIGPVGDFDNDGNMEMLISSGWGFGILRVTGNTLACVTAVANGSRIGGWMVNTANDEYGPVGNFDGLGQKEILISNSWGIGSLKFYNNSLSMESMFGNGTTIGLFKLNTDNCNLQLAGNFVYNNSRSCLIMTSPEGITAFNFSNNVINVVAQKQTNSWIGSWKLDMSCNQFGPGRLF
ncbi:MAG TPA: VCBS repeat-containing protein [Armatimonadota bacterium]|nr:VCBS repeat-containing protein [Armatimonadota bacterium]